MSVCRPCLLLCLALLVCVYARHVEQEQEEKINEEETKNNQSPRSRHLRQTPFHGYDYQRPRFDRRNDQDVQKETLDLLKNIASNLNQQSSPQQYNYPLYSQPPPPFWVPEQQGSNQVTSKILRLLDDISSQLRRPPPPPQVIYLPYPYPPPRCQCNCGSSSGGNVSVPNRFKPDDPRQVWGVAEPIDLDDGLEAAMRPVSFDVVSPKRPSSPPAPPVQHGSQQASVDSQTEAPAPGPCDSIALSCCRGPESQRKACFNKFDCAVAYDANTCSKSNVDAILDWYSRMYMTNN